MKAKSYVGVTGPSTKQEAEQIVRGFEQAGVSSDSSHLPMIGLLYSSRPKNKSQFDYRYPHEGDLPEIFEVISGNNDIFSTFHVDTDQPKNLSKIIFAVADCLYDTGLCQGMQINVKNPPAEELKKIKNRYGGMKLILQVSKRDVAPFDPKCIIRYVEPLKENIDYILIDASLGKGGEFEAYHCANIYKEVASVFPEITLGFAGSLSDKNVYPRVTELAGLIGGSDFFFDAQGGLRDQRDRPKNVDINYFNEHLYKYTSFNPEKCANYQKKAYQALEFVQ